MFGTPITGAVFALEVLASGRLSYAALVPCLMAALLGDWTTAAWGIHHTVYLTLTLATLGVGHLDLPLLAKVAVAAAAFGLASTLFAETTHGLGRLSKRLVPRPWLRPAVGAAVVIALTLALGTRDYLGLGVASPDPHGFSILSSFREGGALPWSWALKLLFTAVTLASGFKGGEVTPLFLVGAALGNALAGVMDAPVALFAALGFVAVFAGATNTPLAQRLGTPKGDLEAPLAAAALANGAASGVTLRHLHPTPVHATPSSEASVSHHVPAASAPHAPHHP